MLDRRSLRLRSEAAGDVIAGIREDRLRVAADLTPLLLYIESNLFDPGLNASTLLRACGVRDKTLTRRFREAVGRPAFRYIEKARLETASRLLADTDLAVRTVARLVGYTHARVFSDAFLRRTGLRPRAYRLRETGRDRRG